MNEHIGIEHEDKMQSLCLLNTAGAAAALQRL